VKEMITYEDYVENLNRYRHVKGVESDIRLALEQMERIQKRKSTLLHVLKQRFEETELSFKKFASVSQEVEKLFYQNIRNILNILSVFDESEFERVIHRKSSSISTELLQKKAKVYNDYLSSMKSSLSNNEEILLKFDQLLLEISSLDNIEPGDIEQLSCMQELDALIKQTKYYKS
jgi:RNA processing factor Prp31